MWLPLDSLCHEGHVTSHLGERNSFSDFWRSLSSVLKNKETVWRNPFVFFCKVPDFLTKFTKTSFSLYRTDGKDLDPPQEEQEVQESTTRKVIWVVWHKHLSIPVIGFLRERTSQIRVSNTQRVFWPHIFSQFSSPKPQSDGPTFRVETVPSTRSNRNRLFGEMEDHGVKWVDILPRRV